jgi:hypothetical protein
MRVIFFFLLLATICTISCRRSKKTAEESLFENKDSAEVVLPKDSLYGGVFVDSITGNRYKLFIKSVDKKNAIQFPLSMEDSICKGIPSGICYEEMEKYYIALDKDRVRREKNRLILKLANGDSLIYANTDTDDEDYANYDYKGTIKELDYFILHGVYMEYWDYVLINAKNGKLVRVSGYPCLSPDKKKIATANFDLMAAFTFNGLEMYSVKKDSLTAEWKKDFDKWGPEKICWKNDSILYVKQKTYNEDKSKIDSNYAQVKFKKY